MTSSIITGATKTPKKQKIRTVVRNANQAEWVNDNPVPDKGELVYALDLNTLKIGDGITSYVNLPSISGGEPGTTDYNDLTNKPQINGVTLIGNKTADDLGIVIPKYLSVERLGAYIYKATFDSIPEYDPSLYLPVNGSCTSFVRNGKLYRNYDWKYDNTAEFLVVCKDFQGISSIFGMNDGALDVKKIEQLPYHVVDGVNKDGIMVSTHVLYNDWTYAGAGDKDQDIMLLPYYILNNLHSITDINTVLANYVANIKIPDILAAAEYLLHFVVTDGTTTYCIMPPANATGSYVIQDITSNPKLTNFRWVSDATVVRTDLQMRPTGVERWNEVATSDLKDLRFTKCYEAATRLSEFIGIDETTKDSTDAELTAIYDLAHVEYQIRTRDGRLWQTVHSVVFSSNGIEHLWCQENFDKDYIGESETVVKNVITLTGESGTLTAEQIAQVLDDTVVLEIVCDGQVFRLSNKDSDLTYRTYLNEDCALNENVAFKAIYIQLNSSAVNYGAWSLEEVSASSGLPDQTGHSGDFLTTNESNVSWVSLPQADWDQADISAPDYIKNKPYIPEGVTVDQTYNAISTNAQSGTAVAEAIANKVDNSSLANVAFTGSYDDLTNQPTIPTTVAQLSDASDYALVNSLANVATTGEYSDLLNTPVIPAAQVQTDWNATSGMGVLLNKPTLANVATTGSYDDLINKPYIPAGVVVEQTYDPLSINAQAGTAVAEAVANKVDNSALANIAFTGEYSDLLNTPTIPTNISQLNNDAGYVVNTSLSNVAFTGNYNDLTNTPTLGSMAYANTSDYTTTSNLANVALSGEYSDLLNKPTIPDPQIQSDWNQTNTSAVDYIKNKPTIPEGVVVDQIYNGTSINAQSGTAVAGAISTKSNVVLRDWSI